MPLHSIRVELNFLKPWFTMYLMIWSCILLTSAIVWLNTCTNWKVKCWLIQKQDIHTLLWIHSCGRGCRLNSRFKRPIGTISFESVIAGFCTVAGRVRTRPIIMSSGSTKSSSPEPNLHGTGEKPGSANPSSTSCVSCWKFQSNQNQITCKLQYQKKLQICQMSQYSQKKSSLFLDW